MYGRMTAEAYKAQEKAFKAAQERADARKRANAEWLDAGKPLSVDDARTQLAEAIAQRERGEITPEQYASTKAIIDARVAQSASVPSPAATFEQKVDAVLGVGSRLNDLTPSQLDTLWKSI